MNNLKKLLDLLFKALGLHDGTKKLLLVFVILTVLQMPYSLPGLWKTGWGIYLSWKNNQPFVYGPHPAPAMVGNSEATLPVAGPPVPHREHR